MTLTVRKQRPNLILFIQCPFNSQMCRAFTAMFNNLDCPIPLLKLLFLTNIMAIIARLCDPELVPLGIFRIWLVSRRRIETHLVFIQLYLYYSLV